MLILEKPYVSDLQRDTASRLKVPVLDNDMTRELSKTAELNIKSTEELASMYKDEMFPHILTNSENSIGWIGENLSNTKLPEKIKYFKDKYLFREMLKGMYPDYYFSKAHYNELDDIDVTKLPKPFVIKPSVGFFSMGVYVVHKDSEWAETLEAIKTEMEKVKNLYPLEVMNSDEFIIEECIEGDEFAVDCYFNEEGEPVILDIMKHEFASPKDVSDRCYITSKEIIESTYDKVYGILKEIGSHLKLKNFPVLMELREEASTGTLIPIEVNPMRFSGWATTDLGYFAYGVNTMEYFFEKKSPDWKSILDGKDGKIYVCIIADLPKDIHGADIKEVDYAAFINHFSKPLEVRKINYKEYPLFGFMYCEITKDNWKEIDYMVKSDLKEFIKM